MKINKKARMRVLSALTAAAMLFAAAPAFADGVEEEEAPAEEVVLVEEEAEEEETEEVVLLGAEESNVVTLADAVMSGNYGSTGTNDSSITYEITLNEDGETYTITFTGTGDMANYTATSTDANYYTNIPWYSSYQSKITDVVIGEGITSIGNCAFFRCYKLTNVSIPSTVTKIGSYAFRNSSLASITIPTSVTEIGEYAFYQCYNLTGITIPDSVTTIGGRAFYQSGLTSITIPNNVTSLGNYVFYYCTSLTSVTIGSGITSINGTMFEGCSALQTVYILQSATNNTIKTNLTNNLTSYFSSSPNVYFLAENVQLSLEPVYDSTPAQIPGQYTLTISGLDSAGDPGVIYRFMTAQMKLAFDADDGLGTDYDITKIGALSIEANTADDIAMIYQGNGEYGFYVDGTSTDCITSHEIALGDVTITGVGSYSLNVDTSYDNKAHSAYLADSIVQDFDYDATATTTDGTTGNLFFGTSTGSIPATGTITLDMIDLTVNVMFPNEISEKGTAYTAMSLTYDNVSLDEAATVAIGSGSASPAPTMTFDKINSTANQDDWKGYSFTIEIPKGYTTSLVFAGDGYRTCNTSVTPDTTASAATVTVWNNVMSESQAVVAVDNAAASSAKVTFLAGDIVGDGEINLFDLSAVTSYFGKEIGESETNYIQYDLNRDGKIDSRDIAMVLVSWNN